jgi:hypothetical protein
MGVCAAPCWPADPSQLIPFAMADGSSVRTPPDERMIVRHCLRNLMLGAFIAGLTACAGTARAASAHDFIAAIYAAHVAANEGFALDADADFRRYFEPALAERMIRAARRVSEKGDRAWLDYDVFVDPSAGRSRPRTSRSGGVARVARPRS